MKPTLLFLFLLSGLPAFLPGQNGGPCTPDVTRRTRALFFNLRQNAADSKIMLGQQDALAYGIGWRADENRSDIKSVCGEHPACYGWDLAELGLQPWNIDSVDFDDMRRWIRAAYRRGGVNTISWHADNFFTDGSSWDTTGAVRHILPGGDKHAVFIRYLDGVADFLDKLHTKGLIKHHIPVIFRPWHEQNGAWFWWGRTHCSPEEYRQLYRFTVDYLRNTRGLRHVLFAYSPDVFKNKEEYMLYYPGDDYVDLMGLDIYHYGNRPLDTMTRVVRDMVELAEAHGKIPAITETGFEKIPDARWWTRSLLQPLQNDATASRLAYILLWRNARPSHFYAPHPGHPSVPDFLSFVNDPFILLENELPDMYKLPRKNREKQTPASSRAGKK